MEVVGVYLVGKILIELFIYIHHIILIIQNIMLLII